MYHASGSIPINSHQCFQYKPMFTFLHRCFDVWLGWCASVCVCVNMHVLCGCVGLLVCLLMFCVLATSKVI